MKGDIAILKLARPIIFDEQIQPACLNLEFKDAYGFLIASGWGQTVRTIECLMNIV